jgi:hypothetical protein
MLKKNVKYFFNEEEVLLKNREILIFLLKKVWLRNQYIIDLYLEAYDYFMKNPERFDGASIVADFFIMPDLDIWAMLHDYLYIKYSVACNYKYKYYADIIYCVEMRRFKIHWLDVWFTRFIGLTLIIGLTFTPYMYFKGLRMNKQKKKIIKEMYYNILNKY